MSPFGVILQHTTSSQPKQGPSDSPGWDTAELGFLVTIDWGLVSAKLNAELEKTDDIQLILPKCYDFITLQVTNQFCI